MPLRRRIPRAAIAAAALVARVARRMRGSWPIPWQAAQSTNAGWRAFVFLFGLVPMRLIIRAEMQPETNAAPHATFGPQRPRRLAPSNGPTEKPTLNDIV